MAGQEGATVVTQHKSPSHLKREGRSQVFVPRRMWTLIPRITWSLNAQSVTYKSSSRSSIFLMMITMACLLPWIFVRPFANTVATILAGPSSMWPCRFSTLTMEVRSPLKNLWSLWLKSLAKAIQLKMLKEFSKILMKIIRDSFLRKTSLLLRKNWKRRLLLLK